MRDSAREREHKMIAPEKVRAEAKKKENENMAFRTFLKGHADEKILDQQFAELHEALFANYECDRCRNCCKLYHGAIPQEELAKDAAYLGMPQERFMAQYLQKESAEEGYLTKHKPCDFLEPDGSCKLGEHKPKSCADYPYTNKPERLWSLYSVLDAVEVCPVAFEIFEELKQEYGFRYRRRR